MASLFITRATDADLFSPKRGKHLKVSADLESGKWRLLDDGVLKSKSVCLSGDQLTGNDRVVDQCATNLSALVQIPRKGTKLL